MNSDFDEAVRSCLSERHAPSAAVKAALCEKLLVAERKRESNRALVVSFGVSLYAAMFSAALIAALWVFTGNRLAVSVCGAFFLVSAASGLIITAGCRFARAIGGFSDGNVYN